MGSTRKLHGSKEGCNLLQDFKSSKVITVIPMFRKYMMNVFEIQTTDKRIIINKEKRGILRFLKVSLVGSQAPNITIS